MLKAKHVPAPFFIINRAFEILDLSDIAKEKFNCRLSFLDLVEKESQEKAKALLFKDDVRVETELVLKTKDSPMALFQISVNHDGGVGHIICNEQNNHIEKLTKKIEYHQKRIAEADFELVIQKEQLEKALKRNMELSGPIIQLTGKAVLIPLFGELTEDLINTNRNIILGKLYESEFEIAYLDFSGIGEIDATGLASINKLLMDFQLLGIKPYIVGLCPLHAKTMNSLGAVAGVTYKTDLAEAVEEFFQKFY